VGTGYPSGLRVRDVNLVGKVRSDIIRARGATAHKRKCHFLVYSPSVGNTETVSPGQRKTDNGTIKSVDNHTELSLWSDQESDMILPACVEIELTRRARADKRSLLTVN
jgi:hypothetical protein